MTPNSNDNPLLWSPADYTALTIFVMLVMGGFLNVEVTWLACGMVKAQNTTSRATQGTNQELSQAREAVLENRAAIDYLLLWHNHGCEELKGMCYFNLSDNSQLIENNIQQITETISKIKQQERCQSGWESREDLKKMHLPRAPYLSGNKPKEYSLQPLSSPSDQWKFRGRRPGCFACSGGVAWDPPRGEAAECPCRRREVTPAEEDAE
ncbi:hypothetical protein QTO34_010457 [Cnephaeus nilssonii]|uniref:Uncharacterized protein n=1 Tax=Cnephaeus nilssonii TaxID=3371016 RepID=A0AA40LFU7_CNENI|nr:hypothetical protein QTO34_010457 [Eptesicus nilssonii]